MAILTPTPENIEVAADAIRHGRLVAFPTETVYGLGANALDARAVAEIFARKNRPTFDPLIVHVSQMEMAGTVTRLNALARRVASSFWPGPLTLVLPRRPAIPGIVTSGLETVAVRMPSHPVALALIETAATPVAAPSANRFGRLSPTTAHHVAAQLDVDLIIDGGPTHHGIESTIVAVTDRLILLRHGAVPVEDLRAAGFEVELGPDPAVPSAPGQLASHYAPHTPLEIADPHRVTERANAAALTFRQPADGFLAAAILDPDGDLVTAASRLFDLLHRLDASGAEVIYVEAVPEVGIGRAIMDRLRRAAHR